MALSGQVASGVVALGADWSGQAGVVVLGPAWNGLHGMARCGWAGMAGAAQIVSDAQRWARLGTDYCGEAGWA